MASDEDDNKDDFDPPCGQIQDIRMRCDGVAKPLAFHQDYALVFEQKDGKPAVRETNGDAAAGH